MNRHKPFHWILFLLSILLTSLLVLPRLTIAQEIGSGEDERSGATSSASGWMQDSNGNLYTTEGKVGIGANPQGLGQQLQVLNSADDGGNAELMLAARNNFASAIHLRENSDAKWGFSLLYDGGAPDPFGNDRQSGMFGIWRVLGGSQQGLPVLSAYRHSNNVGIGEMPSDRDDVRLRVGGHQIIRGPNDWAEGEAARLYLGDYSHWIQSRFGVGIQISPSRAPNAVTIHEETGNVEIASGYITGAMPDGNIGIGTVPSDRSDVRLSVGGHQLVQDPNGWDVGSAARLYLGDYSHYIQSTYGVGIQISPSRAPAAVTIHEETGWVGIGTGYVASPRAKLEIAGNSGVEGLHLSLKEDETPYTGHNSPMIKWDATAYDGPAGPVDRIWYARAQGNNWELVSSTPDYQDLNRVFLAMPDGEVCMGSGCTDPQSALDVRGDVSSDSLVLRERHRWDLPNNPEPGTIIYSLERDKLFVFTGISWEQIRSQPDSP